MNAIKSSRSGPVLAYSALNVIQAGISCGCVRRPYRMFLARSARLASIEVGLLFGGETGGFTNLLHGGRPANGRRGLRFLAIPQSITRMSSPLSGSPSRARIVSAQLEDLGDA